jgi:hypothetical protein
MLIRGYIVTRILATIPVMTVVAIFVFRLLQLTPGDPAAIIAGDYANPEDYIRTAYAKGVRSWSIVVRHALKNAALPVVTIYRCGLCPAYWWGIGDGECVCTARVGSTDRRRHFTSRLPGDSGDNPGGLGHVCDGQPTGRSGLCVPGSPHPLLVIERRKPAAIRESARTPEISTRSSEAVVMAC